MPGAPPGGGMGGMGGMGMGMESPATVRDQLNRRNAPRPLPAQEGRCELWRAEDGTGKLPCNLRNSRPRAVREFAKDIVELSSPAKTGDTIFCWRVSPVFVAMGPNAFCRNRFGPAVVVTARGSTGDHSARHSVGNEWDWSIRARERARGGRRPPNGAGQSVLYVKEQNADRVLYCTV